MVLKKKKKWKNRRTLVVRTAIGSPYYKGSPCVTTEIITDKFDVLRGRLVEVVMISQESTTKDVKLVGYSLKIALFRKQLAEVLPHDHLESIANLAIFLYVKYVESLTSSSVALDAAKNDLTKHKTLQFNLKAIQKHTKRYHDGYSRITTSMLKKLEDHLWYLSESLVVFSLFSDKLSFHEKRAKTTALLRYEKKDVSFFNELLLPVVSETTQLKDLVGVDLWLLFKLLNLRVSFLCIPARLWSDDSEYQNARKMMQCLGVANDSAEKALGLVF